MKKVLGFALLITLLITICMPIALAGKYDTIMMYLSNGDDEIKWAEPKGYGDYRIELINEKKKTIYDDTYKGLDRTFQIYKVLKELDEPSGTIKVKISRIEVGGVDGTFNYTWINPNFNIGMTEDGVLTWNKVPTVRYYMVGVYTKNKYLSENKVFEATNIKEESFDLRSALDEKGIASGHYYLLLTALYSGGKLSDRASDIAEFDYISPADLVETVSTVELENFTWLVNGQEYKQTDLNVKFKNEFPGTITKQQIKINGKLMDADTSAGNKIELIIFIKLNDGYAWDSSVQALLNGVKQDNVVKTDSMGEDERSFVWTHTTEYTDKIKILEQSPEIVEYSEGEDVKLYVKATGANSYQWKQYERGAGIRAFSGFKSIDGATSSEYIIKNADRSLDGAPFICTLAINDEKIDSEEIKLKMVEKEVEEPATTEESPKVEEPIKTEEPVKTEESVKTEEPVKIEEPIKQEEPVKAEESAKQEEPIKQEEPEKEIWYEVEFNTNGGSKIEEIEVKKGEKAEKPKDPTKDGYTFDGWYEDKGLTKKYDFNKEVTSDILLYAKWTEVKKEEEKPVEKYWSKASDWAVAELDKANTLSLIPEIFKSQDLTKNITRKEFAHVAVKLYEKLTGNQAKAIANNPFTDTNDAEVLKAYNVEITNGTSDTTFEPDALITREQMATMMTRALTKAGINTTVDLEKVAKFSDDNDMHDWGKKSIYYMSSIEIIKGMGDGTFGVLGNATREQALLISERSAERFAK